MNGVLSKEHINLLYSIDFEGFALGDSRALVTIRPTVVEDIKVFQQRIAFKLASVALLGTI